MSERRHRRRHHAAAGFTLVELMIVVAITGVLASLAIPAFSSYKKRARGWQAEELLQSIGVKQEAYRAEFGQYFNVSACAWALQPANNCFIPNAGGMDGTRSVLFPAGTLFDTLGVNPGGGVYFGFTTWAGAPNGATAPPPALNMAPDFWWVAQAKADFDQDGTPMIFELTSQSRRVWYSDAKGWE